MCALLGKDGTCWMRMQRLMKCYKRDVVINSGMMFYKRIFCTLELEQIPQCNVQQILGLCTIYCRLGEIMEALSAILSHCVTVCILHASPQDCARGYFKRVFAVKMLLKLMMLWKL